MAPPLPPPSYEELVSSAVSAALPAAVSSALPSFLSSLSAAATATSSASASAAAAADAARSSQATLGLFIVGAVTLLCLAVQTWAAWVQAVVAREKAVAEGVSLSILLLLHYIVP